MGIINVLDISVANLIAAGEVVDRPASAIKEMLENAIDAGAKKITVETKNGGVSLMRVSDNGSGMTKDDALCCIKRHATSKIKTKSDLDGITTLGFRGEALAAISSVTDMRIMTRKKEDDVGTLVTCKNGSILSVEETGCPVGTTIVAENLFSNVPARLKFLKRDITETAACAAVIEKVALSRPDIAITYIADNNVKISTEGDGKMISAIYSTLGRDFAKKTIPVKDMTDGVSVYGYIGTPENVRATRNCENFFINGRYVKCQTAMAALEQAFSSYMPKEKFPCAILSISFNPAFVDVNVHPQKLEVKFSNEKPVYSAVYCAVKNALVNSLPRPENSDVSAPSYHMTADSRSFYNDVITAKASSPEEANKIADENASLERKIEQLTIPREVPNEVVSEKEANASQSVNYQQFDFSSTAGAVEYAPTYKAPDRVPYDFPVRTAETPSPAPEQKPVEIKEPEVAKEPTPQIPDYRIAGVMFNCYIFVETEGKMLVIDKHAAHERVNFERLKGYMSLDNPPSQRLLLPVDMCFGEKELGVCEEYRDELYKIGFDVKDGKYYSYPVGMTVEGASEMLGQLIEKLAEGTGNLQIDRQIFYEKALYQASCKASMKAGREDIPENIDWIVRKVLTDDKIKYCPHGRPDAFEVTKSQFEKRFERK